MDPGKGCRVVAVTRLRSLRSAGTLARRAEPADEAGARVHDACWGFFNARSRTVPARAPRAARLRRDV